MVERSVTSFSTRMSSDENLMAVGVEEEGVGLAGFQAQAGKCAWGCGPPHPRYRGWRPARHGLRHRVRRSPICPAPRVMDWWIGRAGGGGDMDDAGAGFVRAERAVGGGGRQRRAEGRRRGEATCGSLCASPPARSMHCRWRARRRSGSPTPVRHRSLGGLVLGQRIVIAQRRAATGTACRCSGRAATSSACDGVNSSVAVLPTTVLVFLSSLEGLIHRQHAHIAENGLDLHARRLSLVLVVSIRSTRSLGRMKPPAPESTLMVIERARMPGCSCAAMKPAASPCTMEVLAMGWPA